MTLSFWFSLGEAALDADFTAEDEPQKWDTMQAVFVEMILTLVRKSRWPTQEEGIGAWTKGRLYNDVNNDPSLTHSADAKDKFTK